MGALTDQVASLRAFAIIAGDSTALFGAIIDVLEELAEAVEALRRQDPGRGFGSI